MIPTAWAGAAMLAAFALTPLVRRYSLRRGLVDQPGQRRSHDAPVARGGGLAIGVSLVITTVLAAPAAEVVAAYALGSVVICLLGWRDDHAPLPVRWRLGVQVAAAIVVVAWLGPVDAIGVGGAPVHAGWAWTPMAVIAIVWLMNLFNFMDGSDGLASAQAVISSVLFAIAFGAAGETTAAWLAWVTAGASLGFLFWNWPRAGIFLGDSGSLVLGWCMGLLALVGTLTGAVSVWLAFIIVSPFVVDATVTLGWRMLRRERWYTAHNAHAYQYLIHAGWTHRRVLLGWIGLNGVLVVPAAAIGLWRPQADLGVAAGVAIILMGVWYFVHFVMAKERVTA